MQYGFKNVTMDELARLGGISKKTLYEQFKDKDELVLEVVKLMLDQNECQTRQVLDTKKNAIEHLIEIITLLEKMIQGMNIVCFVDLQRYYPKAWAELEKHKRESVFNDIRSNLEQGIREGLFREDIDVNIISTFRMESAFLIFQTSLFKHHGDIVQANKELFKHYLYGIATLKGHKLITKYFNTSTK